MTVIIDTPKLAEFCHRQTGADYVTVDTEFIRDNTYWPQLCLIQISGPDAAAVVDPLAPGIDLSPVLALLADRKILKVFHAARQDVEIFYHLTGKIPEPIFDTQVAAMVCGFGEQASFENLAQKLAGTTIDKSSRFTDWSHRPLSDRQIRYALDDVVHLRPIYDRLERQLEKNGRASWLTEEMSVLTDPTTYRVDPADAWRRLKVRAGKPRFLAVLKEVAAWREEEAQRRDLPRNRLIRDEALLEIAAHMPASVEELGRMRGLSRGTAEGRVGQAILVTVQRALARPESEWPRPEPKPELPSGLAPLIDLLRVLLKTKCEAEGVAQKLVASAADLELIAADDEAKVPALGGWRRTLFGEDALALKHGALALGVKGRRIALIPLKPRTRHAAD
ncbi:MAG TPA: ribonuclease D [Alphaproteobacteria bacterium]|nr:ribonuclease D [Alphaproteobacteria bacterium]